MVLVETSPFGPYFKNRKKVVKKYYQKRFKKIKKKFTKKLSKATPKLEKLTQYMLLTGTLQNPLTHSYIKYFLVRIIYIIKLNSYSYNGTRPKYISI